MHSLLDLPHDIIPLILYHIPDKTPASMTCKLFRKMLLDMLDKKQLSDINDSYYISHLGITTFHFLIEHIHNPNCLNAIIYKFINDRVGYRMPKYKLLKQNCKLNNISKPKYINFLVNEIERINYYGDKNIVDILDVAFINKSFDILMMIMISNKIKAHWANSIYKRYKNETQIDIIIEEINMLIKNNIMSYAEMYNDMYLMDKNKIFLYDDVMKYLEQFLNPNTIAFIRYKN
jgi:hypothetical protein